MINTLPCPAESAKKTTKPTVPDLSREPRLFFYHPQESVLANSLSILPSFPFSALAAPLKVRLWDVAKSRELGRLSFMGHSHPVRSLASSSDGKLLVSGGEDHKVRERSLPHLG